MTESRSSDTAVYGTSASGLASSISTSALIQLALLCTLIAVVNQLIDLKDREIYRLYYESLDTCVGLGCLLISDEVRSPVFLMLIVAGHRLGMGVDLTFTLISIFSLILVTKALCESREGAAGARLTLISLALGPWLYLIQVKLFLAIALYMYSRERSQTWMRIGLIIAAILTHESIVFLMALYLLWRPNEARIRFRSAVVLLVLAGLAVWILGPSSNVFATAFERIQRYNEYAAQGDVPAMSRISLMSGFLLLFGLISAFRLRKLMRPSVSKLELKTAAWMFLPWLIFMAFAANGVFAMRLSELALLHCLLVVPLTSDLRFPSRLTLLAFSLVLGTVALLRDVVLG